MPTNPDRTDRELAARARADRCSWRSFRIWSFRWPKAGLEIRRARRGRRTLRVVETRQEPIDPGTYEITATSPGKKAWTEKASVVPSTRDHTTVVVPKLARRRACAAGCEEGRKASAVAEATPADEAPPASTTADTPEADQHHSLNTAQIAFSFATTGVGALLSQEARVSDVRAAQRRSEADLPDRT